MQQQIYNPIGSYVEARTKRIYSTTYCRREDKGYYLINGVLVPESECFDPYLNEGKGFKENSDRTKNFFKNTKSY